MIKTYYRLESKEGKNALYGLYRLAEAMHHRNSKGNDFNRHDLINCYKYLNVIDKEIRIGVKQ